MEQEKFRKMAETEVHNEMITGPLRPPSRNLLDGHTAHPQRGIRTQDNKPDHRQKRDRKGRPEIPVGQVRRQRCEDRDDVWNRDPQRLDNRQTTTSGEKSLR